MELITPDYWKGILLGVIYLLLSTIFAAFQTSVVKWGSYIGYNAAVIITVRGIIQFILCIAESMIKPNLHIIKDFKSVGIIPKRTTIPIFNEGQQSKSLIARNVNYGSFQSIRSYSQLSPGNYSVPEPINYKTFRCLIWSAVILRGIFGGIGTLLLFEASILLPIGDVQALTSLSAIFTPFLAYLVFRDNITKLHLFSLFGAIIGVTLIVQPSFIFNNNNNINNNNNNNNNNNVFGYICVVSGAFTQSLIYICIQFARKVPVYILILSQSIWSVITGLIVLFIAYNIKNVLWINTYFDILYVLILGLIGYLTLWLLTKSAQYIPSGFIALLCNLAIVWGYIIQCFLFHEIPSWITILGAISMLLAAVIVSIDKVRDARKRSMSVIQRNITTNTV